MGDPPIWRGLAAIFVPILFGAAMVQIFLPSLGHRGGAIFAFGLALMVGMLFIGASILFASIKDGWLATRAWLLVMGGLAIVALPFALLTLR